MKLHQVVSSEHLLPRLRGWGGACSGGHVKGGRTHLLLALVI